MYAEKDANKLWDCITDDIDILVTHGPAYGVLDRTMNNNNAGCHYLLSKVLEKKPQYHLFGHIHEAYGRVVGESTTFINASSVNFGYRLVNPPQIFDITPRTK